ncbi:MAG: hypothetical protein ACJ8AR_15125, partial [Microvirga sp.]
MTNTIISLPRGATRRNCFRPQQGNDQLLSCGCTRLILLDLPTVHLEHRAKKWEPVLRTMLDQGDKASILIP